MLVARPEYNLSVPGVLENPLDWASESRKTSPLLEKPIAIMGASPGPGSIPRSGAVARRFRIRRACVMPLPEVLIDSRATHVDADGTLTDLGTLGQCGELVEALRVWTERLHRRDAA